MASTARSHVYPPSSLQDALLNSAAKGTFADTRYYLYSRRLKNGAIGEPRVVYANSKVMQGAAAHFVSQLNGEFLNSPKIEAETEDYGYDSDSDLEDWASDGDEEAITASGSEGQDVATSSCSPTGTQLTTNASEPVPVAVESKYRVVVPDVAADTWQALIGFIYTGTIRFAPLKSQGIAFRRRERRKHCEDNPNLPPLCSPKSIYRLADIVGIQELKDLALKDLESRITAETISQEMFSKFSSTYEEVLQMELENLYANCMLAVVMPELLERIASITHGDLPHSEVVLSALIRKLSALLIPNERDFVAAASADAEASYAPYGGGLFGQRDPSPGPGVPSQAVINRRKKRK
ncbi:hypothetical protein BDW22DRAFT_1360470 [Trametopsis cervina]|nr:hypothetical protein BDW22DRAFT_1360470 [Trametopsis cervina]